MMFCLVNAASRAFLGRGDQTDGPIAPARKPEATDDPPNPRLRGFAARCGVRVSGLKVHHVPAGRTHGPCYMKFRV
jgi:hypothetical protein